MNSKYRNDIQERNSLIAELKERDKAHNQQIIGAEAEIRELRERLRVKNKLLVTLKGLLPMLRESAQSLFKG